MVAVKFEPRQRTAIDGKTWWVVFDLSENNYSSLTCFGKYKTKRACQNDIDYQMAQEGFNGK